MTVKEFYNLIPSTTRNIMGSINTNLMSNLWSGDTTLIGRLSPTIFIYSFEKDLNPMLEIFCEVQGLDIENLTAGNMTTLYGFLFSKYVDKWTKLYENVYNQEYNPIWNVDGTESITHTYEHGKTTTETKNLTHTMNKGTTDTTTIVSNVTENSRNGFNSANPVGTDKSSQTGSTTLTGSGFDSDVDTGTDTFRNTGTDTERETKTRGGNIGVTSTQNMLEQEINLREKFNYYEIVMNDIINELSLRIY